MGFNNHNGANSQASIKTLDDWRGFIAGGRPKTSRTVANNTTVRLTDNGVAIRLHDTDIVTIYDNGVTRLDSGGWLTLTTKQRMNEYSRAGISQRGGVWYMADGSLFYDGIELKEDGTPKKPRQTDKYEKRLKDIKRQSKQYARDYVEALKRGEVGLPSGGDCWGCYFALGSDKSQPMGVSHLFDHIKDGYYVPSLLANAGREAGYRDEQIGLMGIGGHRVFIEPERVIYKYMVKHMQRSI